MSISSQITALNADKTAIAAAITAKGGTLSQNAGFDTFAADIATVPSGGDPNIYINQFLKRTIEHITADMMVGVTDLNKPYMFYQQKSLKTIDLSGIYPNTQFGNFVFGGCSSLESFTVPEGIINMTYGTFQDCTSLNSVIIPSTMTNMGGYTFSGCSNLQTVIINRTNPPTLSTSTFNNTHQNLTIYVPSSSLSTYQNATNWSALNIQAIPA